MTREFRDPLELEGYEAYHEGCDFDDCPYPEGSDGENAWHSGWRIADKEFDLKAGEGVV